MQKKIVFGVLDWGLGHATRSIPLIDRFLEEDVRVCVASSGQALEVLTRQYPDVQYLELPSYRVRFGQSASPVFTILQQLPHIQRVIRAEHQLVGSLIRKERFHGIISDNRYGVWAKQLPSVCITHQAHIRVPKAWRLAEGLVNLVHRNYLLAFEEVWIPDNPGLHALAGLLSKPPETLRHRYIGHLSRFRQPVPTREHPVYAAVAVLSGPEPARTRFEQLLIRQMQHHPGRFALVRGLPANADALPVYSGIDVFNYQEINELVDLFSNAGGIICRSGYSTLMDLMRIGKPAVLVPTPGQSEQEYLARNLQNHPQFVTISQDKFMLDAALEQLQFRNSPDLLPQPDRIGPAVQSFLAKL